MTSRKRRLLLLRMLGAALCLGGWFLPASATCSNVPSGFFSSYSYIVSPGGNTPASIESTFWAFGFGDPASIAGADSGTWEDTDPPFGGGVAGWLLQGTNGSYLQGTWSTSEEIDGCIDGRVAPGKLREIMVAAFSDADSQRGYFALAAVQGSAEAPLSFRFNFPQDIDLVEIPRPRVTRSWRLGAHQVQLEVSGPTLAEVAQGVYTDGSVTPSEAVLGFRIYVHPVSHAHDPPPPKRTDPGWIVASEVASLGGTVMVTVDCGCETTSYLATSLVFDSGFETRHLSGARAVSCSPPICEYEPWPDFDGDGYTLDPCCGLGLDCDDGNPGVHPGATEVCNGTDDDCDSLVDEDAAGEDSDADGVRNLCDDCVGAYDPSQHDLDSDSVGDACDLDDGLILVSLAAGDQVAWQEEAGFQSWNLYRGALDVLATSGVYTQVPGSNPLAGRECRLLDSTSQDASRPDSRKAAFFLVAGNTASGEGSLGNDSRGIPRANLNPCP